MQLDLLPSATELARAMGEAAARACTDKAERLGFDPEKASEYMLQWLHQHGPTTGEDLVLACREAGHRPHTDKAFGSVIRALSQSKRIEVYGYAPRKRGHGTAGAHIWRINRSAK